jgi:hypothetical protein
LLLLLLLQLLVRSVADITALTPLLLLLLLLLLLQLPVRTAADITALTPLLLLLLLLQALQQILPRDAIPARGRLNISAQQMRSLVFDPIINPIVNTLYGVLDQERYSDGKNGADVLVMAGGFGSSMYLRQRVVEVCGHLLGRAPVTPGDANKAVVLGE